MKLDLRLIEADQVATPDLKLDAKGAVDGIVFDRFGNPREYHVLKSHPGSKQAGLGMKYDRVPAESMIHWFRSDRPGQSRGLPDTGRFHLTLGWNGFPDHRPMRFAENQNREFLDFTQFACIE